MALKDYTSDYEFLPLTKHMRNLAGYKFSRLTALGRVGKDRKGSSIWLCECECGNLTQVRTYCLTSGHTQSCGCLNLEIVKTCNVTHGMSSSKEYVIYRGIKARCYNQKHSAYKNYGGRGITVCTRWVDSFKNFYRDMGPCPEGFSIDRKNNNKGYSPSNCIWVDWITQSNNRRGNRVLEYGGRVLTVAQWARKLHIDRNVINARLNQLHWPVAKALETPVRKLTRRNK